MTAVRNVPQKDMRILELKEENWRLFFQRIKEFCRAAMVTIQLENEGGLKTTVAQDVPLRHLELDEQGDPCNTRLVIEAGAPNEKPVRHVIIEPIHIRLRNGNAGDRYNRVQIMAESGTTTIELHPGLNEGLLKGLTV